VELRTAIRHAPDARPERLGECEMTEGRCESTVPSAVALALFAFLGTWVVARHGFRRCAHANEGDHRDWRAIDEWAAAIAREIQQIRVAAGSANDASIRRADPGIPSPRPRTV
jgi:hypothetical protein